MSPAVLKVLAVSACALCTTLEAARVVPSIPGLFTVIASCISALLGVLHPGPGDVKPAPSAPAEPFARAKD